MALSAPCTELFLSRPGLATAAADASTDTPPPQRRLFLGETAEFEVSLRSAWSAAVVQSLEVTLGQRPLLSVRGADVAAGARMAWPVTVAATALGKVTLRVAASVTVVQSAATERVALVEELEVERLLRLRPLVRELRAVTAWVAELEVENVAEEDAAVESVALDEVVVAAKEKTLRPREREAWVFVVPETERQILKKKENTFTIGRFEVAWNIRDSQGKVLRRGRIASRDLEIQEACKEEISARVVWIPSTVTLETAFPVDVEVQNTTDKDVQLLVRVQKYIHSSVFPLSRYSAVR